MFDDWSDGDLVAVVDDAHRQEAVLMARKLAAIAELLGRRTEEELAVEEDAASVMSGFHRTAAEVSAALNMTAAGARVLVGHAETLAVRLPAVAAELAAGHIDWRATELICTRTALVTDDVIGAVDAALAEQIGSWRCWSREKLITTIDAVVTSMDAAAAKERRTAAYDQRRVDVRPDLDGMARVRASLSRADGAVLDRRLAAMADSVCPRDPRTLMQRRADALTALGHGRLELACACGTPDCPARGRAPAPVVPVVVNIVAAADTVTGRSDQPGYLAGHGIIDAELVRELARDATRRLVGLPQVSAEQALRYRPGAALARYIRTRDLTCRFPGCTVPAARCDIDHTEPFDHADPAAGGQTVAENLACYCREHHRRKTFDEGWRDRQVAGGVIVWTSPSGHTYTTFPGGGALFPDLTGRHRTPDPHALVVAREQMCTTRHANTINRHRNRAAREEIRVRCWRNQFRRFREFFHGEPTSVKPSTSPFARFVNDPIEREELEPNWQPPPLPATDPEQPPPF
ncbi:HNH endonuclease signature motif containing protein [Mycobacterium sp. PSTR-4-N]|uniref:HNH endonuclease signature motif containing protein n=1 Tax=Mycobacterium sp. PSTR-4-N TaxID=2917745 RepID=UPI001F1500CE|nr:HNH endonuclease signature motif containing protein [Mycobacterium sp. PSTR-4-N]MCG7595644.1 HNH endonuclease [Mycobacterium sp. PSTR-4-N]